MAAVTVHDVDDKCGLRAGHPFDALVLTHVKFVKRRHSPVVLQGLSARGLGVGAGEWDVADFEQLRGRKERHVGRIVKKRVANAALVYQDSAEAGPLRLDCTG